MRSTTEALAAELAKPGGATPDWSDLEWRLAMAAAAAHGVSSQLWKRSGWEHPGWRRFLTRQHEHVAIRHRRIEALLERIDARARDAGLAVVPLKGAALYALGMYTPGDRPMADIDLLVREHDADPAARLLCGLGYVQSFDHQRHKVFKPAIGTPPRVLGEHRDTPINIELHSHIRECLPVSRVDITEQIYPQTPQPGLNAYPSIGALMSHLLLHAAGNVCARSLRLMHLHDIALLARRMQPAQWDVLWNEGACGWALPPLQMVARYYHDAIPGEVLARAARECPPWLCMVSRRRTLTQVSSSELWLHAFPSLEWSHNPVEAARYITARIRPSAEKRRERVDMARTQLWLQDQHWVTATQRSRILTWLIRRVPRMDMLFVVRAALDTARLAPCDDPSNPSAVRCPDAKGLPNNTAEVRLAATSSPPQP